MRTLGLATKLKRRLHRFAVGKGVGERAATRKEREEAEAEAKRKAEEAVKTLGAQKKLAEEDAEA